MAMLMWTEMRLFSLFSSPLLLSLYLPAFSFLSLLLFLPPCPNQGLRGPEGAPGERGSPGEGFPGPKVTVHSGLGKNVS